MAKCLEGVGITHPTGWINLMRLVTWPIFTRPRKSGSFTHVSGGWLQQLSAGSWSTLRKVWAAPYPRPCPRKRIHRVWLCSDAQTGVG
jgi:hypothetical protein